jgi:hypothetical protein
MGGEREWNSNGLLLLGGRTNSLHRARSKGNGVITDEVYTYNEPIIISTYRRCTSRPLWGCWKVSPERPPRGSLAGVVMRHVTAITATYAILISMFSSWLMTGAVSQLWLQMHIVPLVTMNITNMQLQRQKNVSTHRHVSPVTCWLIILEIAPWASPMMP